MDTTPERTAACLIANVGQRDLQLDGRPLERERLRECAAELDAAFEEHSGRLSAPIIEPAINAVWNEVRNANVALILVATDQQDESYRPGDTEPAARVVKKLFERRHVAVPRESQRLRSIHVTALHDPPNDYDRMVSAYRQSVVARKQAAQAERIFILCTGGTPACNTALLLTAVERYRHKVTALYVSERTGGICTPLAVGDVLLDGFRRAARDLALERCDFAAIAAEQSHPKPVRVLARAAAARINLDFDASFSDLQRHYPEVNRELDGEHLAFLDRLLTEARDLDEGKAGALLREIYWNAWVCWRREGYADFLGRVWRLMETACQMVLGRVTGIAFDGSERTNRELEKWIEARPRLRDALAAQKVRPAQSLYAMGRILRVLAEDGAQCGSDDRDTIVRLLEHVDQLERARELRNRSVIAHGLKGLSKQLILDELKMTEPEMWQQITGILEALSVTAGENPFDCFAAVVRAVDPPGR